MSIDCFSSTNGNELDNYNLYSSSTLISSKSEYLSNRNDRVLYTANTNPWKPSCFVLRSLPKYWLPAQKSIKSQPWRANTRRHQLAINWINYTHYFALSIVCKTRLSLIETNGQEDRIDFYSYRVRLRDSYPDLFYIHEHWPLGKIWRVLLSSQGHTASGKARNSEWNWSHTSLRIDLFA